MELRKKYIKEALEMGADAIVNYAKENHTFQNITGFLQDSISREEVSQSGSNFKVEVGAFIEYAEAVEHGTSRSRPYPFIQPAIETNKDILNQLVDAAESKALREAGLN